MAEQVKFKAYGENAATFLIFQALAMKPGALVSVLLSRLKRFGTGNPIERRDLDEVDVWLFPNFGKGHGFGEPDVLVLAGRLAFWIEIETTINCQSGVPALRRSLLQLWRFRLFQDAIARPARTVRESRRIVGVTLNNEREVRAAELRLRGHGALQRIRDRLRCAAGNDHYVLFTVNKPKGEGTGRRSYAQVLYHETSHLGDGYPEHLPRLDPQRCWYAYWWDDLERKFNEADPKLDLDQYYVRIKKTQ